MKNVSLLSAFFVFLGSCGEDRSAPDRASTGLNATVEFLEHGDAGLSVAGEAAVAGIGEEAELAGVRFRILDHWPKAEAVAEITDDSEQEHHAVEVSWRNGEEEQSEWIFQTAEEGPTGNLTGAGTRVRLLPPGSRPATPDLWTESPRETVQFSRGGRFHSIPEVGEEPFPDWTIQEIRSFDHALMNDAGEIEETSDAGFANRAIEILLASGTGTVERHLCFLDHPDLTGGIHPVLLPVARLSGNDASQSRLAARDPIAVPGSDHDRVFLCPDAADPAGLAVFVWSRDEKKVRETWIDSLPAEIGAGKKTIRLLQHRSHARSVVKWRPAEAVAGEAHRCGAGVVSGTGNDSEMPETISALVIAWMENGAERKAVLPLDRPTPIRINGQFQTFRYRDDS